MSDPHEDLIAELRSRANLVYDREDGRGGVFYRSEPDALTTRAAQALTDLQARVGEETAKRVEAERAKRIGDLIVSRKDLAAVIDAKDAAEARVGELEGALGSFAVQPHPDEDDGQPFRTYFSVGAVRKAAALLKGPAHG